MSGIKFDITQEMQREIIKEAVRQVVSRIMECVDLHTLANEARDAAANTLAGQTAGKFHRLLNEQKFVDAAIKSAEDRINRRIQKVLHQGITLRLSEDQ